MNLGDGNHFNARGARTIGRRWFAALKHLLTPVAAPGAPAGLTGGDVTMGAVSFSWTSAPTATSYVPEWSADAGATWAQLPSTSGTSATVSGLVENTSYQFAVRAANAGGTSARSAVLSLTTDPPITDTFTRAKSATTSGATESGQMWEALSGTWGISASAAYCPTGTGSSFAAVVDRGGGDQTVSATLVALSGANGHSRLVFRAQDASNYWFAQLRTSQVSQGSTSYTRWWRVRQPKLAATPLRRGH